MERIVYVTGAGFSEPLGIPVMSNFLEKAKDQFFADPDRFRHFEEVFKTVTHLSVTKNYYSADLFNIEEILSILEMQDQLQGTLRRDEFVRFIRDVITFHTPPCEESKNDPLSQLFGKDGSWQMYGAFFAAVLNCSLRMTRPSGSLPIWEPDGNAHPDKMYSIVTLNYDLIPETAARHIQFQIKTPMAFIPNSDPSTKLTYSTLLAKLHGSADRGTLIPPTWSKHLDPSIVEHWKLAHKALREATQIRIIGYSLPIADSYIKYLFKSAVINAPHLKRIDVMCRDSDGSVEKRFRDFVTHPNLRFVGIRDFKNVLRRHVQKYNPDSIGVFDQLENAHEESMQMVGAPHAPAYSQD